MTRIKPAVFDDVVSRANGGCEACGWALADTVQEIHHRKARGMGGHSLPLDFAENLLLVHAACHHAIHAHPERSREMGWIVSRWFDPCVVAVRVDPDLIGAFHA